MNEVKFQNFIEKLKKFYWDNGNIATLDNMRQTLWYASKDSVRRFYDFAIEQGYLSKEWRKFFPESKFLSFPVYGSVKAGSAETVEADNVIDLIEINKYLIGWNPSNILLIRVDWDSMIDAWIHDNDTVILDKTQISPHFWDLVIASVDGDSDLTLKRYLKDEEHKPYLSYENDKDYKNMRIYPENSMNIIGTVKWLFRKF